MVLSRIELQSKAVNHHTSFWVKLKLMFFCLQIFYPDLIDKTEAPEYFLVCHFSYMYFLSYILVLHVKGVLFSTECTIVMVEWDVMQSPIMA